MDPTKRRRELRTALVTCGLMILGGLAIGGAAGIVLAGSTIFASILCFPTLF